MAGSRETLTSKWKRKFSWLVSAVDDTDGRTMLGCKACAMVKNVGKFAKIAMPASSMQLCVLVKHDKCKAHQAAMQNKPGGVPTKAQFLKVLRLAKKGQIPPHVQGIGREKKLRKMKWCLAEAVRMVRMHGLRCCQVLGIHTDARKGRLAVRFTGCGDELVLYSGVLGTTSLVRQFSSDAIGISAAVKSVLEDACTSFVGVPYTMKSGPKPHLDKALFLHLKESVELLNADAATDEQLAGKLNTVGPRPFFPNVILRNKDKAHASRRITSRTWCLSFRVMLWCMLKLDGWGHFT